MSSLSIRSVPLLRRSPAPVSRPSLIGRVFAHLVQEYRLHRDLRRLEALDGRMLHDIGLSGGGLEDAVRNGRPSGWPMGSSKVANGKPLPGSAHTEWR